MKSTPKGVLLAALAGAYFVLYPEDVGAFTTPAAALLGLSHAVSPWLYAVLTVGILSWTLTRLWGRQAVVERERDVPRA